MATTMSGNTDKRRSALSLTQTFNSALALHQQGRLAEAERLYRAVLQIRRDHFDTLHNLGVLQCQQGRLDQAADLLHRAVTREPPWPIAHVSLGNAQQALGRHAEAIESYQTAIALQPDYAIAHFNLANVLHAGDRHAEAIASYETALAIDPHHASTHYMLGNALQALHRPAAAIPHYLRALKIMPGLADARSNLGDALQALNRTEEAITEYRRALALRPDFAGAHTNLIFALNFDSRIGLKEQQEERARWHDRHAKPFAAAIPHRYPNDSDPDRRLRIGYVSAYFRHQAATYAFAPVVLGHDRSQFEVFCYSDTPNGDDLTEMFRNADGQWRDVRGVSDDALADLIWHDRIDILVDLVGHMSGHRLLVFARKPSPVQVSGWGEPTGTGLATMDYLLADPVLVPRPWRSFFKEQIVDLPCFLTFWTPEALPLPGPLPSSSNGSVTFGTFNRIPTL